MNSIKLGAQLYTLRDFIKTYEDCEATFKYLDSIGINVIQISGIGPIPPRESHICVRSIIWMSALPMFLLTECVMTLTL